MRCWPERTSMISIHKKEFLALALLLCTAFVWAQQEQAPENQAPPDPNASQSQNPQASTPSAGPQSSSPSPPQDQPPPAKENSPAPVEETPPASTPHSETTPPAVPAKPGSTSKKKRTRAKSKSVAHPSTSGDAAGQPGKVVVRNGGAKDGLIRLSPGGGQEQEVHNRENTAQLLATTDENLKRISGRPLTTSERSIFDQIQAYVRQARSASDAGDLTRAHTLAFKAHLLSDDLAKR
jgi:outer membrane biosynthesis protein TonB